MTPQPDLSQQRARKVDMKIFVWVIATLSGLMLSGFGWCFQQVAAANERAVKAEAKADAAMSNVSQVSTSTGVAIATVQTDVTWLKQTLIVPRRNP